MKKERVVNIRFLFCIFIGLMLGIIASRLFLLDNINLFVFVLLVLLVVAITTFCIIYAKRTSQYNSQYRSRKICSFLIISSSIGFLVAYILGVVLSLAPVITIRDMLVFEDETYVTGIVSDYVDKEGTYTKFVLSDCEYVEYDEILKTDFKILVYTDIHTKVTLGDKVSFNASLETLNVGEEYDFTQLSQGIGYTTFVSVEDIVVSRGNMTLRDTIHENTKEILHGNLNDDNASICFAVLFGDKHGLSDNISDMFSYAGISHILAVSGLHIGVLVSIIWFALNKFKINKYVKLTLFGLILLFYSYLCFYSPSVCRASIMAFLLALCKTFKWEYDILSSLSLAGIIILIVSPLSLFVISFQLSFMCIFAIICFAPTLQRLMSKIKVPKILSSSLSMSIAVTLAILPICMNTFANISLLGIIANLIVLPIFSLTYILLFFVVVLAILIKPLGVMLFLPNLFLHVIKVVANIITSIPLGVFKVFRVSYLILFILSITFLTIHFLMIKHWWKSAWVGVLSLSVAIMLICYSIPNTYKNESLIISEQFNSNVLLYIEDEEVTMIGSDISCDNLTFLMKGVKLKEINTIIAYDLKLNEISELLKIKEEFKVDKFVLLERFNYLEINNKLGKVEFVESEYKTDYMILNTIERYNDIVAISIDMFDCDVLIPTLGNSNSENKYLIENYPSYDYYVVNNNSLWKEDDFLYGNMINITNTETLVLR